MKKVKFNINNVADNNAKNQIKNALNKIDGVHKVYVDKGESTVTVEYNSPASDDVIMNCLEHSGHLTEK